MEQGIFKSAPDSPRSFQQLKKSNDMRFLRLLYLLCLRLQVAISTPMLNTAGPYVSGVAYADKSRLCNSTTAHANATGLHYFNPNYLTAQTATGAEYAGGIPEASWLVTVKENYTLRTSHSTVWLNTHNQDYWNDEYTQFDACAFIFRPGLPPNAIRLGQDDPGDCSATLSPGCRTALLDQAKTSARKWTRYASPVPYSNLSAGVLPTICQYTADDLAWNKYPPGNPRNLWEEPKECIKDFVFDTFDGEFIGPGIQIVQLTGPNKTTYTDPTVLINTNLVTDTNVNWNCSISDPDGKRYYSTFDFDNDGYDYQTRVVTPILSVFFNVANAEARNSEWSIWASSQLSCLRVKNFTEGSRVPPRLPAGIPYPKYISFSRHHLSRAVWVGMAVGGVAYILIIAAGIAIILIRKRRRQADAQLKDSQDGSEEADGVDELDTGERKELYGQRDRREIDGADILETGSDFGAAELDARPRWSFSSSRPSLTQSFKTAHSTR